MNYEFKRQEPILDQIILVLTLDKQKMKERILIGTDYEIQRRLKGDKDIDLFCDVTRPLGSFLIEFENGTLGDWNQSGISPLRNALNTNCWAQPKLEQAASDFLTQKYLTGNPVSMYAAFRIWNDYLKAREPRDRKTACEYFVQKECRLITSFHEVSLLNLEDETGKAKKPELSHRYLSDVPQEDISLTLWFPDNRRNTECASIYASFYPLITYYLNRLNDWGLCFRKCKVCGKYFLAKSLRYELCSEKCKKAQALQNKREFDERARENNYDLLYKNECQNWRNKINKAKKTAGFPAARLEEMQTAFTAFKKEALQRKKAVKEKAASPKEFMDWLYQQSAIIVSFLPD